MKPGKYKYTVAAMAALLGLALGWRAWRALEFSRLLDCRHCLVAPAMAQEMYPFLGLVCLYGAVARWLPRGKPAVRLAAVLLLCVSVADIAAQEFFYTRLTWHDVAKFWSEADSLLIFLKILGSTKTNALIIALLAIPAALLLVGFVGHGDAKVPAWASALCGLAFVPLATLQEAGSHHPYIKNSLLTFISTPSRQHSYPVDWVEKHAHTFQHNPPQTCHAPTKAPLLNPSRIILVVVESLSSYHSQAYGGIHNWTPQLDQWARTGWQFNQFLANGKTTEEGLFALLTGHNPLTMPGQASVYARALDSQATLPGTLRRHGFHTAFLTSGDLGFMDKGDWLRRVGFDEIEGHDAPFYDGHPRHHFSAVNDDTLYDRSLQWLREQGPHKTFLTIETVSTHQPFQDPLTRKISIEGAFRYADAALGRFIHQLKASGFLDNSLLIVTSDHRAMVPASASEKAHMGARYLSRIPLLVLGQGIPQRQEATPHSQQDLLPSLTRMVTGEPLCTPPWQGFFGLGDSAPPACIASSRSPEPDHIFLQCGPKDTNNHDIVLDAHHTRYLGPAGAPQYLQLIHRVRTGLQPAPH